MKTKKSRETARFRVLALGLALSLGIAFPSAAQTTNPREALRPVAPAGEALAFYEVETIAAKIGPEGGETLFSFPLENVGSAPLKIIGVRADCGCTLLELLRPGQEIAPGEVVEIKGKILSKPTDRSGTGAKRIYVNTSPGGIRTLTVQLTKEAKLERLSVEPQELYWDKGSTEPKEILVTNKTGEAITPRVLGGRMGFTAEVLGNWETGESLRLKITPSSTVEAVDPSGGRQTLGAVALESASKKDNVFVRLYSGKAPPTPVAPSQGKPPEANQGHSLEAKKAIIEKLEKTLENLRREVQEEERKR